MCGQASKFAKAAFAVLLLALILHVVGLATQYWMQTETSVELVEGSIGLWRSSNCSGTFSSDCSTGSVPDSYKNTSFKVTQAFECIILILMLVPLVLSFMYVFMERFRDISIAVFMAVMCFTIVAFAIISMIVWLAQVPTNHYASFSFGLCVMAFVLVFLAAILMLPDIRTFNGRRGERRGGHRPEQIKVAPHSPRDFSYNRRYQTPVKKQPDDNIRHYYNPNREAYMKSPPPTYRTTGSGDYGGGRGGKVGDRSIVGGSGTRTEIMTPDVYLGRSHQRY